jgi:phosphatidylinositol alpha-1,6-mannosyltransferase
MDAPRTLVVTNDFPPRVGGVQAYVSDLVRHLPADRVVVVAPNWPGWRDHDAELAFAVHRWPSTVLWPTAELARRVASLARRHQADVVLFGHGWPLPLLGPRLRRRMGTPYAVLTHGAEVWQACVPALTGPMRRALEGAAAVTGVSRFTSASIRASLGLARPFEVLPPALDHERFHPGVDGSAVRSRFGLEGRRVVVSVSRLVPRKGHDVLIRAMPDVARVVPDAALLIVGAGPYRGRLDGLAADAPPGSVVFAGEVPREELPASYAAGQVFAMPCRSRWGGLEVEGFGIVFLEAAATGRAVIAGRSGGAAEAIVDGTTGLLVESGEPKAVALAMVALLDDLPRAERFGRAGRARVEDDFTAAAQAERLARILSDAAG